MHPHRRRPRYTLIDLVVISVLITVIVGVIVPVCRWIADAWWIARHWNKPLPGDKSDASMLEDHSP